MKEGALITGSLNMGLLIVIVRAELPAAGEAIWEEIPITVGCISPNERWIIRLNEKGVQ